MDKGVGTVDKREGEQCSIKTGTVDLSGSLLVH